jgi:hypothetical protein
MVIGVLPDVIPTSTVSNVFRLAPLTFQVKREFPFCVTGPAVQAMMTSLLRLPVDLPAAIALSAPPSDGL